MRRALSFTFPLLGLAAFALFALPERGLSVVKGAPKQVTYSKDVAPIFYKSCAECHRPGEAAPFSVLSYKETRPWAKSIREKVVNRTMPPWHADPHYGEFKNNPSLTQAEIDTIVAWVEQGAKEGDPKDLPPVPKFAEGWAIGKPDVVFNMDKDYVLKTGGADEIQYFEVPTNFTEDKYIQRAEARPGNRKIVHHIIAFIIPPPKDNAARPALTKEQREKIRAEMAKNSIHYQDGTLVRTKDDAPVFDDGCQLPNGGGGSRRDGVGTENDGNLLCGYAPGMDQGVWTPGTVKKIPAGSKLLFQVHYSSFLNPGGEEKDRSSVGLVFATAPPEREVHTKGISNHYFKIPAGAENHKASACWTAKEDIHIVDFMPHMHLRGKAFKYEAFYPDGRSQVLLSVPKYDFAWQRVYYAKQPVAIPKGTRIVVTAWYDNSRRNKFNPDPTKDVRWGDPTYEEMLIGWINYTVDGQGVKSTTALNGGSSK